MKRILTMTTTSKKSTKQVKQAKKVSTTNGKLSGKLSRKPVKRWPSRPPRTPELTLSARAWLKLQFLCQAADTEVGGFGISSADNLLYVDDIVTVKQECTEVSVEFDDEAVADFFDEQIEQQRRPEQIGRIWVHTHPGDSPTPSPLDEETFARVFGRCHWAIMFILACGGQTYCRLNVNSQVGSDDEAARVSLSSVIPVRVDYGSLVGELGEIEVDEWRKELAGNVKRANEHGLWYRQGLGEACADADAMDRLDLDEVDLDRLDLDEFDLDAAALGGLDPSDESLWDELDEREEVDDDVPF